ncbi:MAG: zinc ribbon domain-containing protein [Phycisphaerae bacterium]|jgi:hypothetical protein|nr:zinc ribbon domain-containing protein [Phycisphaerae bacterium]
MSSQRLILCPRCGRRNVSRARYCAQCGLNLVAAGVDEVTRTLRRNGQHTGIGLLLFLVLVILFFSVIGSLVRAKPRSIYPHPVHQQIVTPCHPQHHPWRDSDSRDVRKPVRQRWPEKWQVER